ncbi:MAG TPA: sigma-54 dependent transcriptional regulator [Candidatus Saccharimonadales bacterium]|nr:sigma-54 dependent transcriptional regulator [Candidatus Saccharimonadales bacterium]
MKTDANPAVTLLAIDDEPQVLELIAAALDQKGLHILTASDPLEGLKIFLEERPRIVLCDLLMPHMNGMQVLEKIVAVDPGTEVILMTAHYSTDSAVEAIQRGACDYLTKPLSMEKLQFHIRQLLDQAKKRSHALQLERELVETYQFKGIVGRSPLILDVFTKIQRVAPHFRGVLVTGATGTGKELVARALHYVSPVATQPFVVCNCSAIVDTLFESELFGHVRGAFTGAVQDRPGFFEFANGGTVFLDEIGELPLNAQAKLLRVLQNHEVQRVGSPIARKVDVRVIAATNRDLKAMVADKIFREDLYYRLALVEIKIPRLAERKEDIPLLQRHFVESYSQLYNKNIQGITRRAQRIMAHYQWPGNVRELENVISSACMITEDTVIDIQDLPEEMVADSGEERPSEMDSLAAVEHRHVLRVLKNFGGNKNRAAAVMGISRTTLYNILERIDAGSKEAATKNGSDG